jgi:hypothetical protein
VGPKLVFDHIATPIPEIIDMNLTVHVDEHNGKQVQAVQLSVLSFAL